MDQPGVFVVRGEAFELRLGVWFMGVPAPLPHFAAKVGVADFRAGTHQAATASRMNAPNGLVWLRMLNLKQDSTM